MAGVTLFFIKMKGCGFCEEAEPEVQKLAAANPGLRVVTKDTTKDTIPFPVTYVPLFVVQLPDGRAYKADSGELKSTKATALAGWVRDVMAGRRGRR